MTTPQDLVAGRYRRERLVGSGGMGTVWEAWDELLDRRVALKQLHSRPGLTPEEVELANQRAMREARITARLSHRYAVPVFDVVEHEGRPCIVMPFIPAVTLAAVLREAGPLRPEEAAGVGSQVAAALAAAHAAGIVHRDVKPGNILVADDGAALISDFGISSALGDVTLTSTGVVHGTPAYLAPEIARGGEATTASDVYSLGSTLYAAVEGSPPFGTDSNSIGLLHRVAAAEYAPPRQAGALAPLLTEMLAADPADRPPMGAVAGRLKALFGGAAARPRPAAGPITFIGAAGAAGAAGPAGAAATSGPTLADGGPAAAAAPAAAGPIDSPAEPAPAAASVAPVAAGRPARRRPVRALAAVVALVVAGVLAGVLWVQLGGAGGVAALDPRAGGASSDRPTGPAASPAAPTGGETASPGTTSPGATSAEASPAPGPDGTPSPEPPAATRSSTAPETTPSATRTSAPPRRSTPSPTRPRTSGTPSAQELATAISSYYALLPGGTDAGWSRLTASYQRGEAVSRSYYGRFWREFSDVRVSNVSGQPPNRATATITYVRRNGSRVSETRVFLLVPEDGQLKINQSYRLNRG